MQFNSLATFSTQTTLIIGSQTKMTVQTKLYNAGEPAYAAILSFDLPSWITVEQKQPSCDYTLNTVVGRNRLLCLVANPLQPKGEVIRFDLQRHFFFVILK